MTQPTVYIAPFRVSESAFNCRCFTPETLVESLHDELAGQCQKGGLKVVPSPEADVRINGVVVEVDEGSQMLRYLVPFLAGATVVHVKGTITVRGEEPEPFKQVHKGQFGLFGGQSKAMIHQALQRIGLFVGSQASALVTPEAEMKHGGVLGYFLIAGGIALAISLVLAIGGAVWAASLPRTNNSIKPAEIPIWACFFGASSLGALMLASVAAAPSRVLNDRSMLWLLAISGVRSWTGVRVILWILVAVAAAACLFSFVVARGS